jgi:hypothetical protein
MIKHLNLFALLLVLMAGCTSHSITSKNSTLNNSSTVNNITPRPTASPSFRRFLAKFKLLKLPLLLNAANTQNTAGLAFIYGGDTAYINTPFKDTTMDKVYAFGLLPDTLNSYKVIWLTPTEINLPVLTVFSKTGKKISEQELSLGKCGSDCCFSCNEVMRISKKLELLSEDSISSCECDSLGPKESTRTSYVLYKTGKIEPSGHILFSQIMKRSVAASNR